MLIAPNPKPSLLITYSWILLQVIALDDQKSTLRHMSPVKISSHLYTVMILFKQYIILKSRV